MRSVGILILVVFLTAVNAVGQTSVPAPAGEAASGSQTTASPTLDVKAAVDTYLAKMPPAQRARSDSYFEGGYWLQLWDFLLTVIVMWLLLRLRVSAGMRNLAERLTRFRPLGRRTPDRQLLHGRPY